MEIIWPQEWRGRSYPTRASLRRSPAPGVEVHHTVTGRAATRGQLISVARAIWNDHVRGRGWADVFYGYLVGDEHVLVARGIDRLSGEIPHVVVAFVGNYDVDRPNARQLEALDGIRRIVRAAGGGSQLAWHGQRDQTNCPGRHLVDAIDGLGLPQVPPPPAPDPDPEETDMIIAQGPTGAALLVDGGTAVLLENEDELEQHLAAGIRKVPCGRGQFARYERLRVDNR